ncbi:MAG: tetratricopeptide repeat protein, partial [Myxococcota bacterium]
PAPRGSRGLLIAGAALALLAAAGLGIYAALGEGDGPAREAVEAGAAPEAARPGDEDGAETGAGDEDEAETETGAGDEDETETEAGTGTEESEAPAEEEPEEADEVEAAADETEDAREIDVPEVPASVEKLSGRARAKRAQRLRTAARRLFRAKRYDKAEELYRKAWQFLPDNSATALGLALVHERKEEMGQAMGWARKAIELSPRDGDAHFLLGTMLENTGDEEGARRAYRKAAQLDPRDKRPRYRLRRLKE